MGFFDKVYDAAEPPIVREAGAYTRPLLSSTSAVLVSEPCCVQFVTSYDPSIY